MQNDPPYLELHLHFIWLPLRLNIFSGLKAVISQTLNLLVRRDLEIIYFLLCALFSCSCPFIFCQILMTSSPLCFLLASRLVRGNQKISLPALSISGIFYDPSICNLMVVEFPLPKLTLGRVPLDCFETHGQFTLKQPSPCFEPPTTLIIYYSVCSGDQWAAVGKRAGSSVW